MYAGTLQPKEQEGPCSQERLPGRPASCLLGTACTFGRVTLSLLGGMATAAVVALLADSHHGQRHRFAGSAHTLNSSDTFK